MFGFSHSAMHDAWCIAERRRPFFGLFLADDCISKPDLMSLKPPGLRRLPGWLFYEMPFFTMIILNFCALGFTLFPPGPFWFLIAPLPHTVSSLRTIDSTLIHAQ